MCIVNECLKDKTGLEFNYHVPTIHVYQNRSSLKDIEKVKVKLRFSGPSAGIAEIEQT